MADRSSSAPDSTRGLPERQQNARDESRIARLDPRGYEDRPAMLGYQDLRQRHALGAFGNPFVTGQCLESELAASAYGRRA